MKSTYDFTVNYGNISYYNFYNFSDSGKNVGCEIIIKNSAIYRVKNLFSVINNCFQYGTTRNRKEMYHLLLKSILAKDV